MIVDTAYRYSVYGRILIKVPVVYGMVVTGI